MKPNGFVAAASMISHTSTPSVRHMSASSLTSPMFTARNVFSSSFTISAAWGDETTMTCGDTRPRRNDASSAHSFVTPPMIRGMLEGGCCRSPGLMRSGEKQRKKSRPTESPVGSSAVSTTSHVVPG